MHRSGVTHTYCRHWCKCCSNNNNNNVTEWYPPSSPLRWSHEYRLGLTLSINLDHSHLSSVETCRCELWNHQLIIQHEATVEPWRATQTNTPHLWTEFRKDETFYGLIIGHFLLWRLTLVATSIFNLQTQGGKKRSASSCWYEAEEENQKKTRRTPEEDQKKTRGPQLVSEVTMKAGLA